MYWAQRLTSCLVNISNKQNVSYIRFLRRFSEKKQAMKYDIGGAKIEAKLGLDKTSKPPANIRFYSWWSTPAGQKVAAFSVLTGSVLAAIYQIAPHTVLLKFTRDYYQHLTNGIPTPISGEMKLLIEEVMTDLQLSEEERSHVKFFVMSVMDTSGWGDLAADSRIGFPFYFHFKDPAEIPLAQMTFGNRGSGNVKYLSQSETESDQAKALSEGLVISKDAKKFAIAREINKVRSCPQYNFALINSSYILLALFLGRIINTKLNLFRKPPLFRGISYGVIFQSLTLLYVTSKDSFNRRLQGVLDDKTAGISPSYAKGGVDYYANIMKRHTALRDLNLNGKQLYSMQGEEIYEYIRMRNKQFKERKQICADVLNKYENTSI